MAVQDILKYIEAHGGQYRLDVLVAELRKAGYPENEIQEALRMKDVPVPPPPGSSKAIWRQVLIWIGAFVGLVVVAIVALVVLSINSTPHRTRDARRISDIKQIQLALELYYDADHYKYPDKLDDLVKQDACTGTSCMSILPNDPVNSTPYYYEKRSDCSYYLSAVLEDSSNSVLQYDINPGNFLYEVGEGASLPGTPCPTPSTSPLLPQNSNQSFGGGPAANPFAGSTYEQKNINGYMTAMSGNRYLRIVSPNGGEALCLNKEFTIRWESQGLSTVTVYLSIPSTLPASYSLGTFPADYNETGKRGSGEFVWTVGKTENGAKIKEGSAYNIIINSTDGGSLIADTSDNIFSILACEG